MATQAIGVLSVFRALVEIGRHGLQATILTFAAFRAKSEVVGLTALTVLTSDARLALTLTSADVTLPVGGTQSMAVTPEKKHKTFLG